MQWLLCRHPALVVVGAASLWLMGGLFVTDQRWDAPYGDGGWGAEPFVGQAVASVVLWPGYRAANLLWPQSPPMVSWLVATLVGIAIALLVDRLVRKALKEPE